MRIEPKSWLRGTRAAIFGRTLLLLIGLSVTFFGIVHLVPGGICSLYPNESGASCGSTLGLHSSLPVQYLQWVGTYLHGDLGQSPDGSTIAPEILGGVPASLLLVAGGLILYLIVAAARTVVRVRFRKGSRSGGLAWSLVIAIPIFWLALILIYVLAIHWRVLPTGRIDDTNIKSFWSDAWFTQLSSSPVMVLVNLSKHLVLPSITLAFVVLVADRLSRRAIAPTHSASFGSASLFDLVFPTRNLPLFVSVLMSGLVIVESVFSYRGLGKALTTALAGSPPDYAMAMDLLMLGSAVLLITKLVADWLSTGRSSRASETS